MRRFLLLLVAIGCVATAALLSTARPDRPADAEAKFAIRSEAKNPWTSLAPNVSPEQFRFVVVSDRTGGHRKGVFSKAVQQVNLLQPEFVMSVGDLIEGSQSAEVNRKQWDDFDRYAKQFAMPFFYCPGNHDANNKVKADVWQERLGRRYYHFTYKNCLFVVMNSNDLTDGKTGVGKEQLAYLDKTLQDNDKVRWTFVFLHHPLWTATNLEANGWLAAEKLLAGRKHNVFCGHVHVFRKFLRNGTSYYQLATTGGSSAMRGLDYGEFDQVAWVTMNGTTPTIAQIGLDGVFKDDLTPIETNEDGGVLTAIEGLAEVGGTVMLKDRPAAGLQIVFTPLMGEGADEAPAARGRVISRIGADGAYTVVTRRGSYGLKPGRYAVSIDLALPLIVETDKPRENPVPEKYRLATTTPYRVEVKADQRNRFDFKIEE